MTNDDADAALVAEVERLGSELRQNRTRGAEIREQLYPVLYVANAKRKISLGRLQSMTGLTRGRIHQIVHAVADRADSDRWEGPVQRADDQSKSGWGV